MKLDKHVCPVSWVELVNNKKITHFHIIIIPN